MTKFYDRLQEGPQTDVDRAQLSLKERAELRTLRVRSSRGGPVNIPDRFTDVYYLQGDERRAAKRFVEENRKQLEMVDFSGPNFVAASLSREMYDWVLHFLGERELRKYSNVIYERRRDGTEWVIDREHFERFPDRRYTRSKEPSVRIDPAYSIHEVYDELGDPIRESDLRKHPAVSGEVRCLLEYFRVAGAYDCAPVTITKDDGLRTELAVEKAVVPSSDPE